MSFYRVGQNRRKKAPLRKKPAWDDSVQDLTVYRATPEEIMLRKEAHKSKNHMAVKLEKMRKDNEKKRMTGAEAKQLAIMKEILYDQKQLQDVLAKSDTMMAVVKDLFGDDPKRFMGFPNVTTAPSSDSDPNRSGSLVASVPDIYTRSEKLSDSVMNQSALNDVEFSDSEDEETDQPTPISYEPKMNLQRFQEYLQEEERRSAQMDPPSLVSELNKNQSNRREMGSQPGTYHQDNLHMTTSQRNGQEPPQMMNLLRTVVNHSGQGQADADQDAKLMAALLSVMAANKNSDFHTPTKRNLPPHSDKTPPSAINDTKKVKKSKKRVPNSTSDSMNNTANMSDMRKVLQDLESEIAAYEYQTGRRPQEETKKTETFSGYTVALVTACSRLTRYLKETDLRVRTEVTLREQLTQDVYQLRAIIDALATDIIVTQEEYGKLYSEHQRYKENTQVQITSLSNQLRELRHLVTGEEPRPASQNSTSAAQETSQQLKQQRSQQHPQQQPSQQQPSQQHPQQQNLPDPFSQTTASQKTEESKTSTLRQDQHDTSTQSGSGSYQSPPNHLRPAETSMTSALNSATAAVMLSPPVRKTRVYTNAQANASGSNDGKLPQRQTSLVDVSHLTSGRSARSVDPPRLTQAPPVMNTVSVPRPIPLVQSNVSIPLTSAPTVSQSAGYTTAGAQGTKTVSNTTTAHPVQINDLSDLVKLGDKTKQQLQQLQEMAVEEALNNPALQDLMQTQIAELNKQQEEARQRLMDLLDNQREQQKRLQDQLGADILVDNFSPIRMDSEDKHSKQQQPVSVSPPISPISERTSQQQMARALENLPLPSQGRGISVSLPYVDLDVSGGSLESPR